MLMSAFGQTNLCPEYLKSVVPFQSVLPENTMGLTVLTVEVGNPANLEVTEEVELLVDSGAIYSVIPTPILERLGIRPLAEQEFRLANGAKIVRKKGIALFRYGERVGGADVVFGEEGDSTLLGAFTLEALGLVLDPLKRELKPLPMLLVALPGANSNHHRNQEV
jgi:predicted aspartyl protease